MAYCAIMSISILRLHIFDWLVALFGDQLLELAELMASTIFDGLSAK